MGAVVKEGGSHTHDTKLIDTICTILLPTAYPNRVLMVYLQWANVFLYQEEEGVFGYMLLLPDPAKKNSAMIDRRLPVGDGSYARHQANNRMALQ